VIAFLVALGEPVHLLGHSRGGHIAFRVAQHRPDLLRSLVLAEPGGTLDASLTADATTPPLGAPSYTLTAAAMVADGDVEGAMEHFIDAIDGSGSWRSQPEAVRQEFRDNAFTVLGQRNEGRLPYTRVEAEGIMVRCLLVGGDRTPGILPLIMRALAAHIPSAQTEILANATHFMFRQAPVEFSAAVTRFLASAT
jgi:pimeloyl-ACP methyl ester carboxylesterase